MTLQVPIERSWLFQGLHAEALGRIAAAAIERRLPAGEAVFREGDPASDLYVLAEGEVELTYVIHARSPITMKVAHIMPGDVFGWSTLVQNETFTGEARTIVESAVHQISRTSLFEIMDEDPRAGYAIMSRLAQLISKRMSDVRTEIRWFLSSL